MKFIKGPKTTIILRMATTQNFNKNLKETTVETFTPQQAIQKLVDGNKRFVSGMRSIEPMMGHLKMSDLAANGQRPFAIVLTCSDSRSPVELIFDQGVGDLFVVRVAGNVVAPSLLASIEFAVANFGSSALVVLGHTLCGAVKATIQHNLNPSQPLPSVHLEELVGRIRPAVEALPRGKASDDREFLQQAIEANTLRSARLVVDQSSIIRQAVAEGKLVVQPAILDLATGAAKFIG